MKKILHVVSCLELGGTESFIMNNFRVIDRSEYQFDFLVFTKKDYPYLKEINALGGKVYYSGTPVWIHFFSYFFKMARVLKKEDYCAVHAHINIYNWLPILIAFLCKVPIRVAHSHAVFGKETKGYKKILDCLKTWIIVQCSTHYLACSKSAGNYLFGSDAFNKKGIVVNNGIDVNKFTNIDLSTRESIREQWQITDKECLIIGNITRFDSTKNIMFVIDVFYAILQKKKNAILILGGPDGGMLEKCQKKTKDLGIEDKVRFVGPRNDMAVCLSIIDIFLFPSKSEGFGIAALEAQAAGCLCMASTNVPKEVDCGIGAIYFLNLNLSASEWADQIIEKYKNWNQPNPDEIKHNFEKAGFSIFKTRNQLIETYNPSIR